MREKRNPLHERWMHEAILEARLASARNDWGVGCVIVSKGRIIARAGNRVYSARQPLSHAELAALGSEAVVKCIDAGMKVDMYCTYEPCPMCFSAAVLMQVSRVFYGACVDSSGGTSLWLHFPPFFRDGKYKTEVSGGILEMECREVYIRSSPYIRLAASLAKRRQG